MMYGYDHGTWMFGGWFVMLLLWLLPVIALFAVFRYFLGCQKSGQGKAALEILEQTYARGEISREEFLQKREDLKGP